jgi:hypothetical protein
MHMREECTLAEAIADRLIELYVRRDEAQRDDNRQEAYDPQHQIEATAAERNELLTSSCED